MYKIILSSLNRVLAVSSNSTINSSIEFSEEYLNSVGIKLSKTEQTTYIDSSFTEYVFNEDSNTITSCLNTSALKIGISNTLKSNCDYELGKGISLPFGAITRLYSCDILDQLSIIQAINIAQADNFCDIKCKLLINGEISKNEFIKHSLKECNRVQLEMNRFILAVRKKFSLLQSTIESSDSDNLHKILW